MAMGAKRIRPARAALSMAIFLALQGVAASVLAQEPADAEPADDARQLDTIVVSYRQSLQAAIDIKRDSVGQVDAIVAEDIGKFPDLNLAESLQRIPGVTITRDAGEGRNISVRGLGPDFTRVRINGQEALSTTGATDSSGGTNRSRGFDFNVFASELFNNIQVRKTASAEVEEGSLGATVDLNIARPFDYDGFAASAAGQAGYNDLSEKFNPRVSALITDTSESGRFGALLSFAYSERELVEEGHSTVRWDRGNSSGGFSPDSPYSQASGADVFHPRLPRYGVLGHDQERLGVTGSLQFRPTDRSLITFDAMYGKFDATRTEDFLQAVSFSRTGAAGKPETIVRDGAIDDRGNLVYGVFDNVDIRSESRLDELSTKFTQLGLTWEQDLSDTFRMSAQVGRSESRHDNPIQTTITMDIPNIQGYSYDYRGNSRLPYINYGFDVTDASQWQFGPGSDIRLRPQTADNNFDRLGLDFAWDLGQSTTLKFGASQRKYEFVTTELRRASETNVPGLPAGVSLASLTRILGLHDLGLPAGTDARWAAPDFAAFADLLGIYSNTGIYALSNQVASARGNNRDVDEKARGLYVQLDWDVMLGNLPVRGNVGVRRIESDQRAGGYTILGSEQQYVSVEHDYSDTLPSLNVAVDLTPDLVLRFGAAKVMARPGLGSLSPGVSISVSGGARSVTGGNPYLDPFRATTADLGLEWYFAPESMLSFAYFYKDIDSYVQTIRETRPFNTSGLPGSLLEGTGASPEDDFQFNIPVNTPGGPLKGFEIGYQQPFSFLPGAFSNMGVQLNYTRVSSDIEYLNSTGATVMVTDLLGLSKNAYNATLYYEGERFGVRMSAARRDAFLTTVPGRNNNDVEGTKGSTYVDLSASWNINDNWQMTLEGLNLTDEFSDQWVDSIGDRASVYHHTGRQYFVGFRYRY